MKVVNLAIIGMGPRGLTVLERLLQHSSELDRSVQLRVSVYDDGQPGQGVHSSEQPDHLLVNTLSSQVTMFAPNSVAGREEGPSLVEWAHASGYRRVDRTFVRDPSGEPISEGDYLPRRILGEYLSWFYGYILKKMPGNINVRSYRSKVTRIVEQDHGFNVVSDGSDVRFADYVSLNTGHGKRNPTDEDLAFAKFCEDFVSNNSKLSYYPSPYPVEKLASIPPSAIVAIQGFGLTAYDVVSQLTLGRGGRYVREVDGLRYIASGQEPVLKLFSRHCLPFAARGVNQKGLTGRHESRFFTPHAVRAIRASVLRTSGSPLLDFERDVLPLLIKEMAFAYRTALTRSPVDEKTFEPSEAEIAILEEELWPLKKRLFNSFEEFQLYFYARMRRDLNEALKGNLESPIKSATDVLRDTREAIRTAVEYGGLTETSHQYFIEHFNPTTNRVSFGPPKQRSEEFLALHSAGLIDIAAGPGARVLPDTNAAQFRIESKHGAQVKESFADVQVFARLDSYSPLTDASTLTKSLLDAGTIRPFQNGTYHPGGIDIDAALHPIGADGQSRSRLWAIGFPVEGPHFYTHALPRTNITSRQTSDADICIRGLLEHISTNEPPSHIDQNELSRRNSRHGFESVMKQDAL